MKSALYHGIFVPMRGLEQLVQSCEFLRSDVMVVFRGYGALERELRGLAKVHENCHFEPPVPMRDMIQAASSADVGVIPYIPVNVNNLYSSPNKLFEYIHAGLPILASDLPFLREVVLKNEIGYVFNPRDPRSIADAINKATSNGNLKRLRMNVQRIQHRFTWEEEQKKLLAIFAQAR